MARVKAVTQLAGNGCRFRSYIPWGMDFGRAFLAVTAEGGSALAGSAEIAFVPKGLEGFFKGP